MFLTLSNSLTHTYHSQGPARATVIKGLLITLLGLFRNIVETGTGQLNSDIGKVFRAKCLVREQFANPELSVQHIAELLGCSADYLSHLFHVETKERLTHYIQRIRIEGAILALETTSLNISEIAYAGGFADPAYFTRIFKQHKGFTPQEYRAQLDAHRAKADSQPKTVFFDRMDFNARASPGKTAGAEKPGVPDAGRPKQVVALSRETNDSAPAAMRRETPPVTTTAGSACPPNRFRTTGPSTAAATIWGSTMKKLNTPM